MGKILFLNFNAIWGPHSDTDLEIMLDLIKEGNEVFSLACGNNFNHCCISNPSYDKKYCNRCIKTLSNGLDLINLPNKKRLKINKYYELPFQIFNDIEGLKCFSYEGINLGIGVASTFMHLIRDYAIDTVLHKNEINKFLNTSYTVYKALEYFNNIYQFDSIYMFNGRFAEYYSAIEFCKKNKIRFKLHDRGATIYKYLIVDNALIQDFERNKEVLQTAWDDNLDYESKVKISNDWFENRRKGVEQNWLVYTKNQEKEKLPVNFDYSKENIVIFNSSMDENMVFDDWNNPIEKNENIIIENIVRHYLSDSTKHFYLRIHPNLADVETTQMKELRVLDNKNYKNLTIIYPNEDIDTYALSDYCSKTIVSGSTMGIESTYWGDVSIVTGKVQYGDLDCVYNPTSYNELFDLINNKDLKPKPKENTYKYGYYIATFGTPFKYFEPNGLFNGKFLGVDLKKKPWYVKLRLAIQNKFKEVQKKLKNK